MFHILGTELTSSDFMSRTQRMLELRIGGIR